MSRCPLAVLDELRGAAEDVGVTTDPGWFAELSDESRAELAARYNSTRRAEIADGAMLRLSSARWEAVEARAAVAELIAERDRLANIVRSHEAQIIREHAALGRVDKVLREFEGMTGSGYRYMAENIRKAIAGEKA